MAAKRLGQPHSRYSSTQGASGKSITAIIDKGQIPLRKELVDRYDLIFVFESLRYREQKIGYAKRKMAILKSQDIKEDHTFLRKVIEHAKTFNPILSEEAEAMITDYWSSLNIIVFPTNRVLETIIRTSIAFARLHFSSIVTSEIAKEAIDFLTKMYRVFDSNVVVVQDPREATCLEIAKFLQENPNIPYEFQDCINYATDHNTLVQAYLGKSPVNNNSSKYRDIADRFKQGLVGENFASKSIIIL